MGADMLLKQKDEVADVSSFKQLSATMTWSTATDFDLAALYQTKDGEFGLVYFGDQGSLNAAPFIELDDDAGVGDTAGDNAETLRIMSLEMMNKVYLLAWDYNQVKVGSPARFNDSDVEITIVDDTGKTYNIVLDTGDLGNLAVIAEIDNSAPDGAKLINASKCGTLKEFKKLAPIIDIATH